MLVFCSSFTPPNSRDLTDTAFPGTLVTGELEAISGLIQAPGRWTPFPQIPPVTLLSLIAREAQTNYTG